MKISLLNHASVIVESGDVRLLCDPWFAGTCYDGGWGLQFDNPSALQLAQGCTHLWISHVHPDHLHLPTLRQLHKVNPAIRTLANVSYVYRIDTALERLGFQHIIPLYERQPVWLSPFFKVTRFPATVIDNMLFIEANSYTLLNFNDCGIPSRARQWLSHKLGQVDVFLGNFNQAGKIFESSGLSDDDIRRQLIQNFIETYASFNPRWVIPFASYHYYRAEESQWQNRSLLDVDDLMDRDARILRLPVGGTAELSRRGPVVHSPPQGIVRNAYASHQRAEQYSFDELQQASRAYCDRIRRGFLGLTRWVAPLSIQVKDLGMRCQLDFSTGLIPVHDPTENHIAAHSEALYRWFTGPYGTSTFLIGAHFSVHGDHTPLKWHLLVAGLTESGVDLRSTFNLLRSRQGYQFLYNRREEILGLTSTIRLHPFSRDFGIPSRPFLFPPRDSRPQRRSRP